VIAGWACGYGPSIADVWRRAATYVDLPEWPAPAVCDGRTGVVPPGVSGNPGGRPKGIKEALPRGAFKAASALVAAIQRETGVLHRAVQDFLHDFLEHLETSH